MDWSPMIENCVSRRVVYRTSTLFWASSALAIAGCSAYTPATSTTAAKRRANRRLKDMLASPALVVELHAQLHEPGCQDALGLEPAAPAARVVHVHGGHRTGIQHVVDIDVERRAHRPEPQDLRGPQVHLVEPVTVART